MTDLGALVRAGYVPCLYAGEDPAAPDLCPGRAWADDAAWVAPDLLWASYPAADCGHTAPWEFLITLTDADLDAADERDRAVYGGDAP